MQDCRGPFGQCVRTSVTVTQQPFKARCLPDTHSGSTASRCPAKSGSRAFSSWRISYHPEGRCAVTPGNRSLLEAPQHARLAMLPSIGFPSPRAALQDIPAPTRSTTSKPKRHFVTSLDYSAEYQSQFSVALWATAPMRARKGLSFSGCSTLQPGLCRSRPAESPFGIPRLMGRQVWAHRCSRIEAAWAQRRRTGTPIWMLCLLELPSLGQEEQIRILAPVGSRRRI